MKLRSLLRIFESEPKSFKDYMKEHIDTAETDAKRQPWMDLWEHEKAKEGEQQ